MRTIPEVAKDPHLWEREMLVKMEDAVAGEMYVPGRHDQAVEDAGARGPGADARPAHRRGAGGVLGYDAARLGALRAAGAVA